MEFIKVEKKQPAESESATSEPTKADSGQRQFKSGKTSKKNITARPILVRASEVEEKAIQWLWENKIPGGMLSLIAGLGGLGKSFWTIYMTAVITNGWDWADGSPCEKGSVLFFYGEEGIADTYKRRFRGNGVDQSKVVFLNGAEWIDEDNERSERDVTLDMVDVIEQSIKDTAEATGLPVKMVVIDPIANYWGGIKENSNAEVRAVLKPLQHLAERTGTAFVLIQHTGKGDKEHAQQRVLGSTGIVAACRSVWGVYADPDEKGKRIFAPVKVNCGYDHTAVSYRIIPPEGRVDIIETGIQKTGDDIESARQVARAGRKPDKHDDCAEWLPTVLADGEKPAKEIYELGKAEGFSERLIKDVKKSLGIESVRECKNDPWRWRLPPDSDDFSQCKNAD